MIQASKCVRNYILWILFLSCTTLFSLSQSGWTEDLGQTDELTRLLHDLESAKRGVRSAALARLRFHQAKSSRLAPDIATLRTLAKSKYVDARLAAIHWLRWGDFVQVPRPFLVQLYEDLLHDNEALVVVETLQVLQHHSEYVTELSPTMLKVAVDQNANEDVYLQISDGVSERTKVVWESLLAMRAADPLSPNIRACVTGLVTHGDDVITQLYGAGVLIKHPSSTAKHGDLVTAKRVFENALLSSDPQVRQAALRLIRKFGFVFDGRSDLLIPSLASANSDTRWLACKAARCVRSSDGALLRMLEFVKQNDSDDLVRSAAEEALEHLRQNSSSRKSDDDMNSTKKSD